MAKNNGNKLMVTITGAPERWATQKNLKELERKNDDFCILTDGTMVIPIEDSDLAKEILKKHCGIDVKKRERKVLKEKSFASLYNASISNSPNKQKLKRMK